MKLNQRGETMKRLLLCLLGFAVTASAAFAGETYSGKEMKQVAPPPCPQWYADNEFNVGLWGTYVFTGNNWPNDRYLEADHAWGGGLDLKYFFHRYFGVGIEGWVVDARRSFEEVTEVGPAIFVTRGHESRAVGAVLGLAPGSHRTSSVAVAASLAAARETTSCSKRVLFAPSTPIPRRRQ